MRAAIGPLAAALAAAAVPLCQADNAPDWVRSAVAGFDPAWRSKDPAVQLLDSEEVRFTAPDRLLMTERSVRFLRMEQGRNYASFSLGYNPNTDRIVSAQAWILSPDGQKVQSIGRSGFIDVAAQYNNYFWDSERILTFIPGARLAIGGHVACEFQVEYNPGFGDQDDSFLPRIPTRRAVFDAIPAPGTQLQWYAGPKALRQPTAGPEPGSLHWEMPDALPIIGNRPDGFFADPLKVFVRCGSGPADTWADFAAKSRAVMDPRAAPDASVKAMAASLVEGKTGRWDRIRALSEFVQRQIVYLEISLDKDNLAGYRPHFAAEVLKNRYGDCKDKATLLISMLRAVGDDGRIVLLFAGDPKFVESEWPATEFNHAIVAIPGPAPAAGWPEVKAADGTTYVIFDPTDPKTPLGVLPSSDQGGFALVLLASNGSIIRLPIADPATSRLERTITASIDAVGRLSARVIESRVGWSAADEYQARTRGSFEHFRNIVEGRVEAADPSVTDFDLTDHWEPESATYRMEFSFNSHGYGRVLPNGMMLVSPNALPDAETLSEWKVKQAGVSFLDPDAIDAKTRLDLPAGYAIGEMPDPWQETIKAGSASLAYAVDGKTVVFQRHLLRRAGFFDKKTYDEICRLYSDLQAQARRPILLRPAN